MRYIGAKGNLLPFIEEVLIENEIYEGTFVDLFSGTGVVGKYFKSEGYKVISNDHLFFSYILQFVLIEMDEYPKFNNLKFIESHEPYKRCEEVIKYLNNLEGKQGFFFNNYSPDSEENRMYFSKENAVKIDAIRIKIEDWFNKDLIKRNEYYYLIYSLIDAIPYVSNTTGVYGAYLKKWDPRAKKEMKLETPRITEGAKDCRSYNLDANKLIEKVNGDIFYLDPPYNSRQYASNYHILETAAKWDNPDIYGKTGLRPYDHKKSDFCYKRKAIHAFEKIIDNIDSGYVLLSYNVEGIMGKEEIIKVLENKAYNGKVKIYDENYRRYRSDSDLERNYKNSDDIVKENIYFCEIK